MDLGADDLANSFANAGLTQDEFLGGALTIAQPKQGYRAGIDPVVLAASVPAGSGHSVLELGCGGGIASLCLARRTGAALTGVELQPQYATLARTNADANAIKMDVICADITALPAAVRQLQFDHVLANPPYFDPARRTAATDTGKETGRAEQTPLRVWLDVAAKRVAPKGTVTIIQRADRLPDLLGGVPPALGSVEVQPLCPRAGKPAHLILMRAKKGGRADFRLNAPIALHHGGSHSEKGKDYNPMIEAVLRNGAALDWTPVA